MARKLRILHYDLETSPRVYYSWDAKPQYLPMDFLIRDSFILTWAAKWDGERKVHSDLIAIDDVEAGNDFEVVASLHELIAEADILVAHNLDRFDWPRINGRFMLNELEPLAKPRMIDTLKWANQFGLAYRKLDFLAQQLGHGHKLETRFELWRRVMEGDEKALRYMLRYNRKDAVLLEKVYADMLPYVSGAPKLYVAERQDEFACPTCGSDDLERRGERHTNAASYQQYRCRNCGKWPSGPRYIRGQRLALRPR